VLLYAEGFRSAKILAEKVVTVFTLSRQLLSPQQHYDWGLRALKTVLTVAGRLIQESEDKDESKEAELLIKAIRINTLSKLTFADTQKFLALLGDVFPGVPASDIIYP
jgi:dynein heavy chain 2